MTAPPTARPRPRGPLGARILAGGWSTGMYVIGGVFDVVAVINVPGAALFVPGADGANAQESLSGLGTGLVLLALVAWASVYFRRRTPLLPLIAGAVLLVIGLSYLLFLVGVLFALLRWRERTRALAIAAAAGVGFFSLREILTPWGGALPFLLSDGAPSEAHGLGWNIATIAFALVSLGLTGGAFAYARTRVEADSSRARADREHRRADALGEQLAGQAERERIARDVHDGLSHRLSVVSLQAGALELAASGDPGLLDRARTLRAQTHAALEDLRSLLGGLRMDAPEQPAPAPVSMRAVGQLLRDLRATGVRIDAYVLIDDGARATAALDSSVYRIVQESLTNAIKHAQGTPISVFVEASAATGVRIRVSNPLTAQDVSVPGSGQGTASIRHRAESLEGTAWLGPHQGVYLVDVSLPWSERG